MSNGPFADFQNEVYLKGLFGELPTLPFGWRETEAAAHRVMTPGAVGYVAGGAGGEVDDGGQPGGVRPLAARAAMLRGIPAQRDHTTTVLGTTMPAPVLLAPIGVLSIVHPRPSRAPRGPAALGLTMVVSTAGSQSMEDVAAAAPDGPRWFQLYWPADRELAASFVARAGGGGLRGPRRHPRHLAARLAAARPVAGLPAVPQGHGRRQLLQRPGVPAGCPRATRARPVLKFVGCSTTRR
jgi:L-lactate dehydrogenase (cytochrome)